MLKQVRPSDQRYISGLKFIYPFSTVTVRITIPPNSKGTSYRLYPLDFLRFLNRKRLTNNHRIYKNRSKGWALSAKFRLLSICMSACWKMALQRKMCTDRMWQQKKKIPHKLCIDMERSEYTLFSMLAILKCEFQWTSILILRYMDSRGWGKAGRHSVAVSSFSASAVRSICLSITAVSVQ